MKRKLIFVVFLFGILSSIIFLNGQDVQMMTNPDGSFKGIYSVILPSGVDPSVEMEQTPKGKFKGMYISVIGGQVTCDTVISQSDSKAKIRYNMEVGKWQWTVDGSSWNDFGSGGGGEETDPIFSNSAASGITETNIVNWNYAYSLTTGEYILSCSNNTSSETPLLVGGTARIGLAPGQSVNFSIIITGRNASGDTVAYTITGAGKNISGTTSLVGTPTKYIIAEDVDLTDASVQANDTLDTLDFMVYGQEGVEWKYSARLHWVVTTY